MMQDPSIEHDVVLLGMGHTHAHVLRMWRMHAWPRTRLTCVSNFPVATYSGMLPGVLAGQYRAERMEIDLVRLCAASRARLVVGHVMGLDRTNRCLLFDDRPPLPFDLLSIGIGSVPQADRAERQDPSILPIKPMQTFLTRLEARLDELVRQGVQQIRVAVVGGGGGGVEIAFCIGARLNLVLRHIPYQLTVIHGREELMPGTTAKTARVARDELQRRGVELLLGRRVIHASRGRMTLDDHREIEADLVVWATSAVGPPLLGKFGLATDERGFLLTRRTLQTRDDDAIFAVGDAGTIEGEDVPKAGVYAVRQGPVLWRNLSQKLREGPLEAFRPQRGFLKLFNTGDGRAIGEYRGWTVFSSWAWQLKDWIDSRFMLRFQDYERSDRAGGTRMTPPNRPAAVPAARTGNGLAAPLPAEADMRCLGCGGKIGGSILSRALARLDLQHYDHVVVGLDTPDDAAVVRLPTGSLVTLSVDFFRPPFDDAFLVGRVAALNAASDCFAIGSKPLVALACMTLPVGPPRQQEQLLVELLAGALHEFRPMGATLAGGHTLEGPHVLIGFSMLAAQDRAPRTKDKLRVGDFLILTKPLGIGVLLAGHMRARCRAEWWDALQHTMLLSNQYAASLCDEFDIQGVTDITGFGLAGHLLE
ncbi:MAG: selenide, water dikinase SelD, partial [Pirellulaceae bacterium]